MVFKILCILIFWVKVALALEGLRASLVVEAMIHHITIMVNIDPIHYNDLYYDGGDDEN